MKILAGTIVFLVSLLPITALATDAGIDSTTLFRFEERSAPGFDKQRVIPATQFLGADVNGIGDENLSFHFYGWGRVDLADRSTADGKSDGDLTYGYLRYYFPKANGEIKAGRFFIYEGGIVESINGVSARADLLPTYQGLALSLFGGVPVALDRPNDNKGNYIGGGRLSYRYAGLLELGGSVVHEGGMDRNGPDSDLKNYRQLVGGDIWLTPLKMVELNGRTFYNTATGGISENSYLLTLKPSSRLTVTGLFDQYNFKDYFSDTNLRSLFNPDAGDKFKSYGGSVTCVLAKPVEITADYRRYQRDSKGNSNRYGAELRATLADNRVRSGFSYHRLDAAAGIDSYHEVRGYALYDQGRYFGSIDAISHFFDDSIENRKTAFEAIASIGYRIMPDLALSGDLSYGENPLMAEDLRGVIRLTYNYNYTNKGAGK